MKEELSDGVTLRSAADDGRAVQTSDGVDNGGCWKSAPVPVSSAGGEQKSQFRATLLKEGQCREM